MPKKSKHEKKAEHAAAAAAAAAGHPEGEDTKAAHKGPEHKHEEKHDKVPKIKNH